MENRLTKEDERLRGQTENETRGNEENKNESQTEIEMHGINFRPVLAYNLPNYQPRRDLIKDALRFISKVEWSSAMVRTADA